MRLPLALLLLATVAATSSYGKEEDNYPKFRSLRGQGKNLLSAATKSGGAGENVGGDSSSIVVDSNTVSTNDPLVDLVEGGLSPEEEGAATFATYDRLLSDIFSDDELLSGVKYNDGVISDEEGDSPSEKDVQAEDYRRRLMAGHKEFGPLSCNANLISEGDCSTADGGGVSLSSLVNNTVSGEEVVIPCGVCVSVDYDDNSVVDWDGGLNILGKLYVPSTASLTLRVRYVFVQGMLTMDAPDSGSTVKFRLFGTDSESLFPAQDNELACDMTDGCSVGKKPFVIAGGQVNIEGLSDPTCPSWVKLKDVSASPFVPTDSACTDLVSFNGDAESSSSSVDPFVQSHIAAPVPIIETDASDGNNKYFAIRNRRWYWDGLLLYSTPAVGCITNETTEWVVNFKYRMPNSVEGDVAQVRVDYKRLSDGGWTEGLGGIPRCPNAASISTGWVDCNLSFTLAIPPNSASEVRFGFWSSSDLSDLDFDDISISPAPTLDRVDVGIDATSCWNVGDSILLTSPDMHHEYSETFTIDSIEATSVLVVSPPLPAYFQHGTEAADPNYAVEVARLTRSIVFEAEDDDATNDRTHGGHLIVYHTPHIVQKIEGAELVNFGQQGTLGRYPIHFHMSGDCSGSVVSKNVVRESNQRCIVIHGTHNVNIIDNVAYDTKGHCFFTEDGIETGNTFQGNLGSNIRSPMHLIPGENDNHPSVFWITNPENHWIDNVAAGSDNSGFWFDTRHQVRGPSKLGNENVRPQNLPLGTFTGNTAHSSNMFGIQYYAPGWQPLTEQVSENSKVYRNRFAGHFVHGNRNLAIVGGLAADNGHGIQTFRNANIRIDNVKIIGSTPNYGQVVSETGSWWYCRDGHYIDGLTIHPWTNFGMTDTTLGGTHTNLEFSHFGPETGCNNAVAIQMDIGQINKKHYDAPNRFSGLSFLGNGDYKRIQVCNAVNQGEYGIAIEDTDGTLGPTGNPGFLVGTDDPTVTTFANATSGTCLPMDGTCLSFCDGACLRTLSVITSNAYSTQGIEMVVTDDNNALLEVTDSWHHFVFSDSAHDHTYDRLDGYYGATLPPGDYTVSFRDSITLEQAWPDYVEHHFEESPICSNSVTSVTINKPDAATTPGRCSDLIKGGNFDDGNFDAWQQFYATLGSSAFSSSSGAALTVTDRDGSHEYVSQWVDVSCIEMGKSYVFSADIRMEDEGGNEVSCNSASTCPRTRMVLYHWNSDTKTRTETSFDVASANGAEITDGFYRMEGTVIATEEMTTASRVQIRIDQPASVNYVIDNVSMKEWTPTYVDEIVAVDNVLSPNDALLGVGGSSPGHENVDKAADGSSSKFLVFMEPDVAPGFEVVPTQSGCTVLTGLRVYTANDGASRDPSSFLIEGKRSSEEPYETIAQGRIFLADKRNPSGLPITTDLSHSSITFFNTMSYQKYRVTFPEIKQPAQNIMQFGEVELPGYLCPESYVGLTTEPPTPTPTSGPTVSSRPTSTPMDPSTYNLSLNKPAVQSCDGAGGTANRAVDGNYNPYWSHGSVTHTCGGPDAWWEVDLLNPNSVIRTVKIYNRLDCCADNLVNFEIQILDLARSVVTVQYHPDPVGAMTTLTFDDVKGRFVRIRKLDGGILALAEVEVTGFTQGPAPPNLALGKTTSQSSTCHGGDSSNAVDGNNSGRWSSSSVTHTCGGPSQWWKVDLEESETEIHDIVLFNRLESCCSHWLSNFEVHVLDENGMPVAVREFTGTVGPVAHIAFEGGVMGRSVVVRLLNSDPLCLGEVEVYGVRHSTESPTRYPTEKPTTSHPTETPTRYPTLLPTPALPVPTSTVILPDPVTITASSEFSSHFAATKLIDSSVTLPDVGTTNNQGGEYAGQGAGAHVVVYEYDSTVVFNTLYYAQRAGGCDKVIRIKIWVYDNYPGDAISLKNNVDEPDAIVDNLNLAPGSTLTEYYTGRPLLSGRYIVMELLGPQCNPGGKVLKLGYQTGMTLPPTPSPTTLSQVTSPLMLHDPISITASSEHSSPYVATKLIDTIVTLADVGTMNNQGGEWAGAGGGAHVVVYQYDSMISFNTLYFAQRAGGCDKMKYIRIWLYDSDPGDPISLKENPIAPVVILDDLNMVAGDSTLTEYYVGKPLLSARFVVMEFYGPMCNPGGKVLKLGYQPGMTR